MEKLSIERSIWITAPRERVWQAITDPPHQVAMRSAPHPPETPVLTTWTLEEENGGTRVTVNESGYERMPPDARQARMDQDTMGYGAVLDNIKAHVDGVALPYPQGF